MHFKSLSVKSQIAERFKRKGNDALKRGPKFYDEAIGYYTEALQAKCNIAENNSIYHSNRSVAARRCIQSALLGEPPDPRPVTLQRGSAAAQEELRQGD